jgi:fructose-1,6-bisphosphatase/sedoheptulose 1,7-bisphosphatase-like protein
VLAAPIALARAGLTLGDIDLIEMHEAFAAQVLSNIQGLASTTWAARAGLSKPVGEVDFDTLNVMGGSLSIGHPFGATGARVQPISDGDVQAAIACGFAGTGTHCLMGIGAAPEGVISAAALRALGGHFQGQLVYDPAVAQTSEWEGLTREGNLARLAEMGITDPDRVYEAEELACGENVVFAATGITDGLLFDGVKFEKDCTRTSSLVISTLDNTARFTTTVHIKDGAQSIALR